MARPLRILVPGGWYHVVNRGNRKEALFLDDDDRRCFLGLVGGMPERFGLEVHAYVLMENHYHLLVRMPEANLSDAIRWLQVSYGGRFNRAHGLHGHMFQGRFKAALIQQDADVSEVARHMHLNPVRVEGLGLEKGDPRWVKASDAADPGAERIARRLERLEEYRWSSWRAYLGKDPRPEWLETGFIGRSTGGRSREERVAALLRYTESPVRQGRIESPWDRLIAGVVLGEESYARSILDGAKLDPSEQREARSAARIGRVTWADVVQATEVVMGRPWAEVAEVHGDWTRDGALHVAVQHGRLRLSDVQREVPGLKYQAAAQAVRRFRSQLAEDPARQRFVERLRREMSKAQA